MRLEENSNLPTRFRYRLSPVNMRRGLWVVAGSLVVLMVLGALASESLAETMLEDLQRQPAWALAVALVGIIALTTLLARIVAVARDSELIVDSDGIRCSPHRHHGPRNWLRHDWQLPWSAIDRAVIRRPDASARQAQSWINTTLVLESRQGQYDMALLLWDPVGEPLERPDLMAFRSGRRLHELTESHPLIRHLERRGIEVERRSLGFRGRLGMGKPAEERPEARSGDVPVDLLSFRSLVIMLALTAVLALGAALHFMILPPIRPLWSPDYGSLMLAASVVCLAGVMLSRPAPLRERTIVALLLGASVGLLAHPLSVRMKAITAESPRTADYIMEAPGQFQPIDAGFPALDLTDLDVPEYWRSLSRGAVHPFDLQRVDEERNILRLRPLLERTRAFYASGDPDSP